MSRFYLFLYFLQSLEINIFFIKMMKVRFKLTNYFNKIDLQSIAFNHSAISILFFFFNNENIRI